MKIVVFGDSFSAGAELTDETEVPNWPGYFDGPPHLRTQQSQTEVEKWQSKYWFPWLREQYGDPELMAAMVAKEKSLTYANKIAEILNWTINNHANSGSSMYNITRNIIEKRFANNFKDSIIFYQPTSIDRFCQYIDGGWTDIVFSNIKNHTVQGIEFHNFCKSKISFENTYSLCIDWYKEFYSSLSLLQTSNCKAWYIVDVGFINLMDMSIREYHNKEHLSELMRYRMDLELLRPRFLNLGRSVQLLNAEGFTLTHCPRGHFSPKVHDHFAEVVVNRLKTDNLL